MLTNQMLNQIVRQDNARHITTPVPPIITAIKRIIANRQTTAPDHETLSPGELWALAEIFIKDPAAFNPYVENMGPSKQQLENALRILNYLNNIELLNKENTALFTDPVRCLFLISILDANLAEDINIFLIQQIKNNLSWRPVFSWLKSNGKLNLAALQKVSASVDSLSVALNNHYNIFQALRRQNSAVLYSLVPLLINNSQNASIILDKYSEILQEYRAVFLMWLDTCNITVPAQITFMATHIVFFANLHLTREILLFILSHVAQFEQWKNVLSFLEKSKLLTVENLVAIENNLTALSEAMANKSLSITATSRRVFDFAIQNPQHVHWIFDNEKYFDAIKFLLDKRPNLHKPISMGAHATVDAQKFIQLLDKEKMLEEDHIDFIIDNLSSAFYFSNCLSVLEHSNLTAYYGNILEEKENLAQVEKISHALNIVSQNNTVQITTETLEIVLQFAEAFANVRNILGSCNEEMCKYLLSSPPHVRSIAAALLIITQNADMEQYKPLIIQHPAHAKNLMEGIRSIIYFNTLPINDHERSRIISLLIKYPAYAKTIATAYTTLINQGIAHENAYKMIDEHAKYALDIALAIQLIRRTNLEQHAKTYLEENVIADITGEKPQNNTAQAINFSAIGTEMMKENSDYANFSLGKMHAGNQLNAEFSFYNARINLKKIKPESGWYWSAQRELCELLYHECDTLKESGSEQFEMYKKELDEVANNLRKNCEENKFLINIESYKITPGLNEGKVNLITNPANPELINKNAISRGTQTPSSFPAWQQKITPRVKSTSNTASFSRETFTH